MARKTKIFLGILVVVVAFVILIAVTSKTPEERFDEQVEDILSESSITYDSYSSQGFEVNYPEWEMSEHQPEEGISVSKGICSVAVNTQNIPAKVWYNAILDSVDNSDKILVDEASLRIKNSKQFQDVVLIDDTQVYECNEISTAVTVSCLEDVQEKASHIYEDVFNSVSCNKESFEEKYQEYEEDDFSISYPGWDELNDEHGDERILGVSRGVCSMIVNKYNARPGDVNSWVLDSIDDNDDELLSDSKDDDIYYISYRKMHEGQDVTFQNKFFYCNYMTYAVTFICVDELVTQEYEETANYVLANADCAGGSDVPDLEEEREEVEEEELEEIEKIVKTNVGEEYGIDEEMVVYFVNGNDFFKKVLKDFPKANMIIEDKENNRELELRVLINEDGEITSLEDGLYDDDDVTMRIPLRDALNIFTNAENLNPFNLIGFAINVKTEPAHIKNDVIEGVLRGEYN